MRYPNWGLRSARWSGIRSETVDVRGVPVHYLAADPAPGAPDAPTHLLVHAMTGSGTNWLDLIPPLATLGPVLAPDLPGTVAGHTPSPTRRGPRAETNARFLRAFARTLDLDRIVVHGWSMGGLVSALFADLASERIVGLALTAPPLAVAAHQHHGGARLAHGRSARDPAGDTGRPDGAAAVRPAAARQEARSLR
ncbi:MAG: alpha/beta fold hydrolase [Euzebyales bacterium]|nr:alpha/beta fold hydrolase [Euzebyales bacterium]